ncbi:putative pantothenate transporter [Eremomyces bilateralis CBS 781.70]|uniref:Pantothenate transporter n=1 Tax=Eremomyces bilateralis CBS 781.70 TaxID=1392243 RepID=A0A6G1GH77_9PEZI|nr:putative pantothenate transporter [Eremomyces bilateralis CBS 781.70]KAF1817455.1 putative pantothenate transporter [Eremomyces bilateralis CBS 781.70]
MADKLPKDKREDDSSIWSESEQRGIEVGPVATKVVLDNAKLVTTKGNIITKDGAIVATGDLDSSDSANPFTDPQIRDYYIGVYEKAKYECRHVFDADATWTEEEEKKIVKKLDWHVCLWACIMFFSLQIDRGNINQAVSGTFLKDLRLNTNDFNLGNTVFLVSFLLAELPSQLISKKLGPDRWIPMQMVLWSIVAMSQAALRGRSEFLATRALLGVLEGGFIPDLVLWLSYFYTSRELPMRLSFFWTALSVTGIFASLLAFGIFHLEGHHGLAGWRWIFLIEGTLTLIIGIVSFFFMPASAVQTKSWFRPKGWFTDRELTIVVNRVLRDDPSKGDMHNRQAITPSRLWAGLKDYDLWPLYMLGAICFVPQAPPAYYLTQILRNLGFSTFQTNLLTIPSSVFHMITLISLTWLSEKINQRGLVAMLQGVWTLPCIIALRVWPGLMKEQWPTYALLTVLLSYPYCHAINVGWISKNSNNVGSRSISAALYNMMAQVGGIISANIYRDNDKPLYKRGNQVLIGINILSIALFLYAKIYYVVKNKIRERKWNAMTPEERVEYTYNTTDTASRRLDFRFAH